MIDSIHSTYWYNKILSEPKARAKVTLYKKIVEQLTYYYRNPVNVVATDIGDPLVGKAFYMPVIRFAEYGLNREDACHVWASVILDYPLAFFTHAHYKTIGSEGLAMIVDQNSINGATRMKQVKEIEAFVNTIKNAVKNSNKTSKEKALDVYRYLCEHGEYDNEMGTTNYIEIPSHSILGYVSRKKAVCEGFSKTYQTIMLMLGIECICINGIVKPGNGKHAWNEIIIGGERIPVDVTFGIVNKNNETKLQYFGNKKVFENSHVLDYKSAYFNGCNLVI